MPHPHPHPHPQPHQLPGDGVTTGGTTTTGGVGMRAKYEKVLVGNFNTPSRTVPVPILVHTIPSSLRNME